MKFGRGLERKIGGTRGYALNNQKGCCLRKGGGLRNSKFKNQNAKLQFKIQKEGTGLDSVFQRNDR